MLQRTATRMRDKIELEAEQQGWRPELLQQSAAYSNTLQHSPNTLLRTAPHCCILQHTATYCYILLHTATRIREKIGFQAEQLEAPWCLELLGICNNLQKTATSCKTLLRTLLRTATRCCILQHTATYCNMLQHTATYYNILQHAATYCNTHARQDRT